MKLDKDSVCIVTGGVSGIGLQTVLQFLSYGCKVVAADLNAESGAQLVADKKLDNLRFFKTNVADEENVKALVDFTLQEFGRVVVVVNSAGIAQMGKQNQIILNFLAPLIDSKGPVLQNKDLLRIFQINVMGTVNVCKYAAAAMIKNEPMGEFKERGVLVNISSVNGVEGQREQISYSASKGAINGMTLPMARDLGRFGIRVVTIAPGLIETPMTAMFPETGLEIRRKASALGRNGTPQEIAQCIVGLCVNSYINGVIIRVDGGTRYPHLSHL